MARPFKIGIKSKQEIAILRDAGKILSAIVESLKRSLKSGMTTREIDALADSLIRKYNVVSAFKGYRGYPGNVCVSVNEEVVHGIPGAKVIKDGDIVSIDAGIIYREYYSDMAVTVGIGTIDPVLQKLIETTQSSLSLGIEQARAGNHLFDISHAVQNKVESNGFSVVREFVGHGIGRHLHEDPEIPNFGEPHEGPILEEGMVFAIEPMVNVGDWRTKILNDGWTVVTADRKPSAHFEHTVVVLKKGAEILTQYYG
ncbi:MAG: type I methionyl aminopeptidase [Candidatus Omnitrophica bacterium]|nr:type I methionyl aminopeptidase [Candidatus Omnitrophota bacterium]